MKKFLLSKQVRKSLSILLVITLLTGCLESLQGIFKIGVSAYAASGETHTQTYDLLATGNYSDIFSSLSLEVETTENDRTVNFELIYELDNYYILSKYKELLENDEIVDQIEEGTDINDILINSSIPVEIEAEISLGTLFSVTDDISTYLYTDNTNTVKYGEWSETDTDNGVDFNVTFFKNVYAHKNVTGTIDFSADYSGTIGENIVPVFDMNNNVLEFEYNEHITAAGAVSENEPFAVKKTETLNNESNSYFQYKIDLGAYEKLNGTTLVDQIPVYNSHYLEVTGVTIEHGDSSVIYEYDEVSGFITDSTDTAVDQIYIQDNELKIHFTNTEEMADLVTATVYVDMQVNAEYLGDLAGNGASYTNNCYLQDGENTYNAEPVVTNKKVTVISKDGQQNPTNSSKFDWTVDMDLMFYGNSSNSKIYMIDTLNTDEHDYDLESDLKIYTKNNDVYNLSETRPINTVEADMLPEGFSFENATASQIESVIGDEDCVYVNNSENNTSYMLVDITSYLPDESYNENNIRIAYSTLINEDKLSSIIDSDNTVSLSNRADIRWKHVGYGKGPDPDEFGLMYNVSKECSVQAHTISKTAGDYNEVTQMQEWDLLVNEYGYSLEDFVITDDLGTSMIIPDDYATGDYIQYKLKSDENYTSMTTDSTKPVYFTLDNSGTTQKIVINMGDISDAYDIKIMTKLTGEILSTQTNDSDATISNSITAASSQGTYTANAESEINNVLISKASESFSDGENTYDYDFENRLLKWSFTINENELTMCSLDNESEGPMVIDILPEGTSFDKLSQVIVDDTAYDVEAFAGDSVTVGDLGTIKVNLTSNEINPEGHVQQTIEFTIGQIIDHKVQFIYTTNVDGEYCNNVILRQSDNSQEMTNNVTLTGRVLCEDGEYYNISYADADATVNINAENIVKTSAYSNGVSTWTVNLNQIGAEIGGCTLIDEYSANMSFVEDSLIVYKNTVHNDGTISEKNVTDEWASYITYNDEEHSFTIDIPNYTENMFTLVYKTIIVDDVDDLGADISNKITLKRGDNVINSTPDVHIDATGSFSVEDYQMIAPIPFLLVNKISASINDSDKNVLKLSGAKFNLYKINNFSIDTDNLSIGGTAELTDNNETNVKGHAVFVNLKAGNIYMLEETVAPEGYALDNQKYYVYIKGSSDIETENTVLAQIEQFNAEAATQNKTDHIYVMDKFKKLNVQNTPENSILFYNVDSNGTTDEKALAGTVYSLKRASGSSEVKTKTATADANGLVTFENVDPGTYYLYQTANNNSYKVLGNETGKYILLTVESDGTYTFSDNNTTDELVYAENSTVVNNEGTNINTGVTIVRNVLKTAGSGNNTYYKLSGIPVGTYTLKEYLPEGYCDGSEVYINYKVEVTGTATGTVFKITDVNDQELSKSGSTYIVDNTPIKGIITLDKHMLELDGNYANATDNQAAFTLYRVINGTPDYNTPVMTAQTNADGSVTFTGDDIIYGDYAIKETTAADGYYLNTSVIYVTRSDLTINKTQVPYTFSYDCGDVNNDFVNADIKINKIDQNGDPVSGISFKLYRLGNQVQKTSDDDYSLFIETTTTDSNGNVSIDGLPYGIYMMKENESDKVNGTPENIYIKVDKTNEKETVSYYFSSENDLTYDALDDVEFTSATAEESSPFLISVENELKYGFVQVNKVLGFTDVNGQIQLATENGTVVPLSGIQFNIYRECDVTINGDTVSVEGVEPFLSLTTQEDGSFDTEDEGNCLTKGNYYIQEVPSDTNNYSEDTHIYSFSITDQDEEVLIENNEEYFVNTFVAGTVTLTKADSENITQRLNNAVFTIFTLVDGEEGIPVASLIDENNDGIYELSNEDPANNSIYNESDSSGVDYLTHTEAGYALVQGNYIVRETGVPEGYFSDSTPSEKRTFTIDEEHTSIVISNTDNLYTNSKIRRNIILSKSLSMPISITGFISDSLIDFEFTLTRISDADGNNDSGITYTTQVGSTDDNGALTFENVPYGKYILSETDDSDNALPFICQSDITLLVMENGVYVLQNNAETLIESSVSVVNTAKTVTITGTSVGVDYLGAESSVPLQNVEIGLYTDAECAGTPVVVSTTDEDGYFDFTNVVYGTYYVKQIDNIPAELTTDTDIVCAQVTQPGIVDTAVNECAGENVTFINPAEYSDVSLTKTDSADHSKRVENAEFGIYYLSGNEKIYVASVKESNVAGEYVLSNEVPEVLKNVEGDTFDKNNITGIDYLISTDDGWKLLKGDYEIVELVYPEGYTFTDENNLSQAISVTPGNTTVISNVGNDYYENKLISQDITVNKNIDAPEIVNSALLSKAGFTFSLTRIGDIDDNNNSGIVFAENNVQTAETNENGQLVFEDVPYGSYVLNEIEDGEKTDPYIADNDIEIDVTIDGIFVNEQKLATIEFKNTVKTSDITGKAYALVYGLKTYTVLLKNVEIYLYSDEDCTQLVATVLSDAEGKFNFEDIGYGTYYMKNSKTSDIVAIEILGDIIEDQLIEVPLKDAGNDTTAFMYDRNGNPVGNIKFGVFEDGTVEFLEENIYDGIVFETAEDGSFIVPTLPDGNYVIHRIEYKEDDIVDTGDHRDVVPYAVAALLSTGCYIIFVAVIFNYLHSYLTKK